MTAETATSSAASAALPPSLTAAHVRDAKLFANRYEMAEKLTLPQRPLVIAEVGVALGHFTEVLIRAMKPERFVAFDTFNLHAHELIWGEPSSVVLKGMSHLDFYKSRFAAEGERMVYEVGNCHETLAAYPDQYFDLIYIDAGHEYRDVKVDTLNAARKAKSDGILIFNDYLMFDYLANIPYGVVRAANELIVEENWRVIGLAMHPQMFCDLAIRRG